MGGRGAEPIKIVILYKVYPMKSTVDEIRARFDQDVERFSNLETGQVSTIDATVSLELITGAAKAATPEAKKMLDLGCGAGNYSLMMLAKIPGLQCTLVDLSLPMLNRATERLRSAGCESVVAVQRDIRELELQSETYDIILAGAVLHHLRDDSEWELVFAKLYGSLRQGGSLWISDLVVQEHPAVTQYIWNKYGDYLVGVDGTDYRDKVFAYIEKEDTPRSVTYQLELMRKAGFSQVEVLHKNVTFAAYGAIK